MKSRQDRTAAGLPTLREYLARHSADKITETMDQALANIGDDLIGGFIPSRGGSPNA